MSKKIKNIEISEDVFELFVKAYSNGIDLTEYLSDFRRDVCRLSQVYYGLKESLDVSIFAHSEYTAAAMVEIRYALKNGIDLSFLKPYMNEGMIRNIIFLKENGINIEDYINETTSEQEIRFIGERLLYKENIDYLYADIKTKNHFKIDKMKILRKMYKNGFNLDSINTLEFNEAQLKEIYKGFAVNINYTLYAKKEYDYKVMREIRENLEFGILDIPERTSETDIDYIKKIKEKREKIVNDFDCSEFNLKYYLGENYLDNYNEDQLNILKETMKKELPIDKLVSDSYSAEQMEEIMYGLEDGLDVSVYNNPSFSDVEMNLIRNKMLKEKKENNLIDSFIKNNFKKKKAIKPYIVNNRVYNKDDKYVVSIDYGENKYKCFAIDKESNRIKLFEESSKDLESFVIKVGDIALNLVDIEDKDFKEFIDIIKEAD